MSGIKVVTIGGGSSYTPELVEGFIKRYDELPIRELWLVDIPEGKEKLTIVGNLAKRMVEKAGIPLQVYMTTNRKKALQNADFVTTQIRVGQLEARAKDERIPLKHNVIGQETNGPGGLFKGLRTIPVILEICKEIEEYCPNAWLINFSNPAGMITEAVLRHSNINKVIGLCNLPITMRILVAKMLNVDFSRIEITFAGLNHMMYGLQIFLDGGEITEKVLQAMGGKEYSGITMNNIPDFGWEPEFIEELGALPCPYHRYYYKTKEMLEEEKQAAAKEGTRAEVVKKLEKDLFELYKDPELAVKPPQLEKRGGAYYSDAACSLITSIYNDKHDIQTVNTKNNGAIQDIPYDSAVEINCVITKHGPLPITVGYLPDAVKGLVQSIKSFEQVSSDAAVTGSYSKALLAMTINPLVPSDTVAKSILDEMLQAHAEYLPNFQQ